MIHMWWRQKEHIIHGSVLSFHIEYQIPCSFNPSLYNLVETKTTTILEIKKIQENTENP